MAGNLALYWNITDFSLARSAINASPLEQPLRLVGTATYVVDNYFVQPTGNPADPWEYVDPAAFTNVAIELAATDVCLPLTPLAFCNSFTYVGGETPYLEGSLNLFTETMGAAIGGNRGTKCVFEMAWTDAAVPQAIQSDCFIIKGVYGNSSGTPGSITYPPFDFASVAQVLSLGVQNRYYITDLTGDTTATLDGIPTANAAALVGWIVRINNAQGEWLLKSGTNTSDPTGGIVLPADYDASTNAVYWLEIG